MNESVKRLLDLFGKNEFWENGIIMIIICAIISVIFLIVLWIFTDGFKQRGLKVWMPVFICMPTMLFGGVMMLSSNGTGGFTQHFYLGILVYSFHILMLTSFGEFCIIVIRKLLKHHQI